MNNILAKKHESQLSIYSKAMAWDKHFSHIYQLFWPSNGHLTLIQDQCTLFSHNQVSIKVWTSTNISPLWNYGQEKNSWLLFYQWPWHWLSDLHSVMILFAHKIRGNHNIKFDISVLSRHLHKTSHLSQYLWHWEMKINLFNMPVLTFDLVWDSGTLSTH